MPPSRRRFPRKPYPMSYLDLISGEPVVARRWIAYTYNGIFRQCRWHGACVGCGNATWAGMDGTIDEQMGGLGLVVMTVPLPEGHTPPFVTNVRVCWRCASNSSRIENSVIPNLVREFRESGDPDIHPIEWPDAADNSVVEEVEEEVS